MTDWEAIIVDDGSSDQTVALVTAFSQADPRFKLVLQANRGPSAARNTGLSHSDVASTYVSFLDGDDLWTPDALDSLIAAAEALSGSVGAQGVGRYVARDSSPINEGALELICQRRRTVRNGRLVSSGPSDPTTFACLAYENCMPTGTILLRRDALHHAAPFPTGLRSSEDYYAWILASRNGPYAFVDKTIFSYRRHDSNTSGNARFMVSGNVRMSALLLTSGLLSDEQHATFVRSRPAKILALLTLDALRKPDLRRAIQYAAQALRNLWGFKIAPLFERPK
jgi:glycosyltransferase involved in cell wall biosynthesis